MKMLTCPRSCKVSQMACDSATAGVISHAEACSKWLRNDSNRPSVSKRVSADASPVFPALHCCLDKTSEIVITHVDIGRTSMKWHKSSNALIKALHEKIQALTDVTKERTQLPEENDNEICLHPALHTHWLHIYTHTHINTHTHTHQHTHNVKVLFLSFCPTSP